MGDFCEIRSLFVESSDAEKWRIRVVFCVNHVNIESFEKLMWLIMERKNDARNRKEITNLL